MLIVSGRNRRGTRKENKKMRLRFQVADVRKPSMSVQRIIEKGDRVSFGPKPGENCIENMQTGFRLPLVNNGRGSYQLEVNFVGGGRNG